MQLVRSNMNMLIYKIEYVHSYFYISFPHDWNRNMAEKKGKR